LAQKKRKYLQSIPPKYRCVIKKIYIQILFKHLAGQSRVNPERKEEEKVDTDDFRKA